ncbi:MAG: response regulator transcription factor [Solirubrobacterales bacterium]|nr:response regulator transcription factor [Solirubrobacterales bacterium]
MPVPGGTRARGLARRQSTAPGVGRAQALGARPAAAIVARQLLELGERGLPRGPRQKTRANPAGLTVRELEVLELLAVGLRNVQIAERLVLSGKTVDHHVSAVLRKLNVRSRGEATAEAARLGLLGPIGISTPQSQFKTWGDTRRRGGHERRISGGWRDEIGVSCGKSPRPCSAGASFRIEVARSPF